MLAKNCHRYFQICKYGCFKYLKKGSAKNSGRYFDICKYALLNISKVYQHKIFLGVSRFASILFLNI